MSSLLDEATLAQNNHLLQEYILHSSFYTFSPTSDPTRMVKSTDTGVPAGTGGADYVSFPSGRMENGGNVTNSYKVTSPPGHTMVGTKRHTRKKNPYICRCALSVGSWTLNPITISINHNIISSFRILWVGDASTNLLCTRCSRHVFLVGSEVEEIWSQRQKKIIPKSWWPTATWQPFVWSKNASN